MVADAKRIVGDVYSITFNAADVVVELFLQFVGRILLFAEILNVVVENLVGRPVHFADLLQNLQPKKKKKKKKKKKNSIHRECFSGNDEATRLHLVIHSR